MNAAVVVERLRELDARSGGRRVAWGPKWREERERFVAWLRAEVPGVDVTFDCAGNLWGRRAGESPETVIIGSHMDCVPDGGWLDGCLGLFAAAEVLRSTTEHRRCSRGSPRAVGESVPIPPRCGSRSRSWRASSAGA